MRIALISPYDWCVPGGVNNHVSHLSHYFRKWGHDVTIFAPASDPESVAGECHVFGRVTPLRVSGSVARISFSWKSPEAKRLLAEQDFDVMHAHEPLMPLVSYHLFRYSNAVKIGTFHAAKEGGNRFYRMTMFFSRMNWKKLDGKIAVSPAAQRLIDRYYPSTFQIIPNGIEYEHFSREREPLPEFADGKRNILFVGRPEKRKGLRFLLRAYLRVRGQEPNTRLIVVGAGDFSRYSRIMSAFDDVVFRENVPYDELPRYHKSAAVFCCPNTGNESQGYVLLEAMAAGLPVVASNIEGFAGVVTEGIDGILTRPKDVDSIAEALLRVIRDPALGQSLGERGRHTAERYSWDSVARHVLSYYERVIYERTTRDHHQRRRRLHEPQGEE
ncbi:MAG: glycosyltransferase family 4 protein [Dehalococcoidia bacterium]